MGKLSKYFNNSDLEIMFSVWQIEGKESMFWFMPFDTNETPQFALQKVGAQMARIDFVLKEIGDKLTFTDLITNRSFYLNTSEIHLSKMYFIGSTDRVTLIRQPVESSGFFE